MADVYKCLGQAAPASGTDTDVYTVPASTAAIVSSIVIANRGAADDYVYARVRIGGATIGPPEQVFVAAQRVPGNGEISLVGGITLGAGDVITVTPGGSNLSVSVFGVEQSPVPAAEPKVLGQLAPSVNTLSDLYTVPSGKSAVVSSLAAAVSINAATTAVRIAVSVGGGAVANKDYVLYDFPMSLNPQTSPAPTDCNLLLVQGITLAAGDKVRVRATDACSFNLFGVEL